VARSTLRDFSADPVSIEAINAYFNLLDKLQDPKRASDAKEILACFDRSDGFDFKTGAEKFKLIGNSTVAVIIPFNQEALGLVDQLKYVQSPTSILRQLQNYTVNIYENEFQALNAKGLIAMVVENYAVLKELSNYDDHTGIHLPARDGGEAIFFD
jgi:CRISPR-associated endonuclease/helicase Cas3